MSDRVLVWARLLCIGLMPGCTDRHAPPEIDRLDCVFCHDGEQAASRVDHGQLDDPGDCAECHDTTAWIPAELLDHGDLFPLRGHHRDLECAECHTDEGSYAVFTCTDCHAHEQARTDRKHRECVAERECRNYEYDSQACYDCHRDGRGDD